MISLPKILFSLYFVLVYTICVAQTPFANSLIRVHSVSDVASLNGITGPFSGNLAYVNSEKAPFFYNGNSWRSLIDLIDNDNDTWIRVDDGNDNDEVELNINAEIAYKFDRNRLQFVNDNGGVFIGNNVGSPTTTSARHLTFIGQNVGVNNTTGTRNTAVGSNALYSNTTGIYNSVYGRYCMYDLVSGGFNSAFGASTLQNNTSGSNNSAFGSYALSGNETGSNNSALGTDAIYNCYGSNNIGIGYSCEVPYNYSDNQVRIGNTDISYAGIQVSWSTTSDLYWKQDIRDLPYGINFINKLRPVDFKRKNAPEKGREMGFIAQEVKKSLAEIGYTDQGFLIETDKGLLELRYADFISLCIKGIQEQQIQLEAVIEENKRLFKRIEELEKSNLLRD